MSELDRLQGLIIGGALGDALGAPHEFRYQKDKYSGKLEYRARMYNRFVGEIYFDVGQVTDDTEMHMCIINRLVEDKKYVLENVIKEYLEWANANTYCLGRNTRQLLKGVKTLKGYKKRYENKFSDEEIKKSTLGNGALMRCGIFGYMLYKDKGTKKYVKDDCNITNPNVVSLDCNVVLTKIIELCFRDKNKKYIKKYLLKNIEKYDKRVQEYVMYGLDGEIIDINNKSKGLCLYGMYCAIYSLMNFDNYKDGIDYVINKKGDTDTNACISGYVLGSYYGYKNLLECEKKNIKILLKCTTETSDRVRKDKYKLVNILEKIEILYNIFK